MALDRETGTIVFRCDYCDTVIDTKTNDYGEAMNQFMAAGWRSRKVGAVWKHACPDHKPNLAKDAPA
jgi:hypothetical protein